MLPGLLKKGTSVGSFKRDIGLNRKGGKLLVVGLLLCLQRCRNLLKFRGAISNGLLMEQTLLLILPKSRT